MWALTITLTISTGVNRIMFREHFPQFLLLHQCSISLSSFGLPPPSNGRSYKMSSASFCVSHLPSFNYAYKCAYFWRERRGLRGEKTDKATIFVSFWCLLIPPLLNVGDVTFVAKYSLRLVWVKVFLSPLISNKSLGERLFNAILRFICHASRS